MDTFGPQTVAPPLHTEKTHRRRRVATWLLALAVLGGCKSAPTELGNPRNPLPIERLAQLDPGVSTMTEVVAVLGQPQGRGKARMPNLPAADVLLYESDALHGTKMRMKMLIVFVRRDSAVYEGYMWFNSGLLVSPANSETP